MKLIDAGKFLEGARSLSEQVAEGIYQAVRDAVSAAEQHAQASKKFQNRSYGPGNTRGTIKGRSTSQTTAELRAGGAMRFLENGTRAHGPVKAKALRYWTRGGQIVFRQWVRGISPRFVMRDAGDHGETVMWYAGDHYIESAIDRLDMG